jgi:hypothetical protein
LSVAGLSSLVCLWLKSGVYPRVEHLKEASFKIRLNWKDLPRANTLAWYIGKL